MAISLLEPKRAAGGEEGGMSDRRRSRRGNAPPDAHDEVPEEVVTQAKDAFGQRTTGEVVTLVFDSLVDEPNPGMEYRLRFEHPREHVELVVSRTNGECTLQGHVDPALLRVELELEGTGIALVDEATTGTFAFAYVPRGLTRIILVGPEGSEPLHTDWFRT
jgi:hypothetical protein